MLELANHKKTAAILGVLLCIPMAFIILFAVQFSSVEQIFTDVSKATVVLPDGEKLTFTEEADLDLYAGMISRASVVKESVRDLDGEEPLELMLDGVEYKLYLSLSTSGCMAISEKGTMYLLSGEDAAALMVREEMSFLYDDSRLPSLKVVSGDRTYAISPKSYDWSYRVSDGTYRKDDSVTVTDTEAVCNLFADFKNGLQFSVEPSHYSFTARYYQNGEDGYELPLTSLGGLHFSADTLISVEITAVWSQASNASQYGEASYRFLVLYDVPAVVKLNGGDEYGRATVRAGELLILHAEYTNKKEDLEITFDCTHGGESFRYDSRTGSSYAFLPIPADTPAGEYELKVRSGETETVFAVTVEEYTNDKILSIGVSDEDYAAYFAPEKMEAMYDVVESVQKNSDGTPLFRADLVWGKPVSGEIMYHFGATVIAGNANAENDAGVMPLQGVLYSASRGDEVEAIQQGVCVFAGELGAAGNTVIVDHGAGIFSYYCNLGTITAEVGEELSRSEELGTVGEGNSHGNLFVAVSVDGTFVNIFSKNA
ncbi:MAG: peptidoglycan DD-metalloendopeptidase family protein [Clostridia bacterium]|nr:peptidoglycan DD-metalloendopeptidase family protein [Clostridia bacterium]